MGDRTRVTLTILTIHHELVQPFVEAELGEISDELSTDLTSYFFDEVNYGELRFLPELTKLGIAYDSRWESGSEYSAGTEYSRFTETGDHEQISVYDDNINPSIDKCMEFIQKNNTSGLVDYIQSHYKRNTPLDWDNQVEYGKLYRTKQLINSG